MKNQVFWVINEANYGEIYDVESKDILEWKIYKISTNIIGHSNIRFWDYIIII